jgi:hypothetical protein
LAGYGGRGRAGTSCDAAGRRAPGGDVAIFASLTVILRLVFLVFLVLR